MQDQLRRPINKAYRCTRCGGESPRAARGSRGGDQASNVRSAYRRPSLSNPSEPGDGGVGIWRRKQRGAFDNHGESVGEEHGNSWQVYFKGVSTTLSIMAGALTSGIQFACCNPGAVSPSSGLRGRLEGGRHTAARIVLDDRSSVRDLGRHNHGAS